MTLRRILFQTRIIIPLLLILLVIINLKTYFSFKEQSTGILENNNNIDKDGKTGTGNLKTPSKIKSNNKKSQPLFTIVTAASSNHFCALQSWLYYMKRTLSLFPTVKRPRIVVYDLGLVGYQKKWMKILYKKKYFNEFKQFDFESYPSFWKIDEITRGEYGWKPGIIYEIVKDYPGAIFWLDSGTFVTPNFLKQFNVALDYFDGFFSPKSSGYMLKWTHPGVFEYYNDNNEEQYSKIMNCNGAAIAFDSNKIGNLINDWFECALRKECIAPEGSNRDNHRQDQAILTYLAAKEERYCTNRLDFFGIKTHMDNQCEKNIYLYEKSENITWSPTSKDLNEMENMKILKEVLNSTHEIYDIWNPGAEQNLLDRIQEEDEEQFNYFFNKIQKKI